MAQTVETTVNIRATADTSQAEKAIDQLWKSFAMLNDMTLSLNKNSAALDDKSILAMRSAYMDLADTITKCYETGLINEKQQENLGVAFAKSWTNFNNILETSNKSLGDIVQKQEILEAISHGGGMSYLKGLGNGIFYDEKKANEEIEKRAQFYRNLTEETAKRVQLEEQENKVAESTQDYWANIIKNEGTANLDSSIAQNINNGVNLNSNELGNNINITNKLLDVFANKIGVSKNELLEMGKALGINAGELVVYAGAAAVAVGGIKLLIDNTKEMITTFKNVGTTIGEGAFNSIEWFVDSLQNMVDMAEQAIQTLDKLAEAGTNIERAFLTTSAYIGQDATDQVYDFMQSISGASKTMFASINDVVAAAGSMGLASDQLVEATENMTIMGRNLGVLIGDTQKAFADLGQTISKGYVGRNSILYRIFTKQEIEQVRKLSSEVDRYNFILERAGRVQELYNAYIETAAGKVSLLKLQYQELMNNIGLIALNLYAMVAPVLTKILTIANQLLSVLISVFGWEPKSVGFTSIASDIGQSLEDVAGSAAKANKQLASFDDVIQINEKQSGGGGVGGIDPQALGDFSGLLDDALGKSDDFVNLWEHFKELMSEGDYFGAGTEFMHVIGDLLRSIDWNKIKSDVRDVASDISKFINGLFDEDARKEWEETGKFIGEAINTAFAFLKELLYDIDFNEIGKSLGAEWSAMWDTINAKDIADTLYYVVIDAFDLLAGWLEGGGLSKAASKIAEIIKGFFTNFSEVDLGDMTNTVVGVVDNILNAIKTVVDALTSDDVKEVIFGLITRLVTAFKENAGEWGTAIHDIVASILDFIIEGFETADKAGVIDAVLEFIQSLKLDELLSKYLRVKWELFKIKAFAQFQTFVGTTIDFFLQAGLRLVQVIIAIGAQILLVIGEAVVAIFGFLVGIGEQAGVWLRGKIDDAISAISTFFSDVLAGIKSWGEDVWDKIEDIGAGIGEKFEAVGETIESIFSGIWDFISDIFDPQTWIDLGTAAINALWDAIKSIWNSTVGSLSLDIPGFGGWDGIHVSVPKLATGGIVTGATNAIIGEAGAEAVLPLENNTQWMDKLAAKINNSGGNAGGTIRVQLADKPFYTRAEMYEFGSLVVESLKAYGLNIAMV
jgi:hypothetical protein